MLHYRATSKELCRKCIATGLILLLLVVLSSCRFLQGESAFYDTSKEPNADHIAQNYVEDSQHYRFISFGESLGATTIYERSTTAVKIFPVGETGNFICFFTRRRLLVSQSSSRYTPYLCVKKGYKITNEFGAACLAAIPKKRPITPAMALDLEEFEPCPGFIPLMEQAYREMERADITYGELIQSAVLDLTMYLPLRECPEVGIQGRLFFGADGLMYWNASGVSDGYKDAIIVGPYDNLPELPEGGERFAQGWEW